jgi:hypothetical protein
MKIVKQIPSVQNHVVAVRCDKCGAVLDNEYTDVAPVRIEFDAGVKAEAYTGDYCRACGDELAALLARWRQHMRVVARFDATAGHRVFAYEMLDAATMQPIAVRSLLDEPELR